MKYKEKSIVIILGSYPNDSEAFITNHIVGLIDKGYKVRLSVSKINSILGSSQEATIRSYNIQSLIFNTDFSYPKYKLSKLLLFFLLVLKNLNLVSVFLKILVKEKTNKVYKCFELVNFKKKFSDNLYHIQFATNGKSLLRYKALGLFKESKVFVTFHGYDAHFNSINFKSRKKQFKNLFNYANGVIVNSKYLKNKIIMLGCPEYKIHKIGISYNSKIFSPKDNYKIEKPLKIISVGRLTELKGQVYGLRTIKFLKDKNYNVIYTIIGYGKDREILKEEIKLLNLENEVKFLGKKTQSDIAIILKQNDVFLMTSIKDNDNRSEAFGLVNVEAQVAGLPVIAFNSGGVSESLKNNITGFLVKEKDVEAMAESVISFIDNPEQIKTMGLNASKHAMKSFNATEITNKHIKIYEKEFEETIK